MVEGARLESVYTGNRIAGSNPAPSATRVLKTEQNQLFSCHAVSENHVLTHNFEALI